MQVARRLETDAHAAGQVQDTLTLRAVPMRADRGEAGRGGNLARQPSDERGVGGVPLSGQRERAVEVGLDMRDGFEQGVCVQPFGKAPRRDHGAHGVRTRWADADLEEVEEADRHGRAYRRWGAVTIGPEPESGGVRLRAA